MLNDLMSYRLLLGSKSPRRAELLRLLEWPFEVVSIDVNEEVDSKVPAKDIPEHLAVRKSMAYGELKDAELLITSDTVVILDDQVLGKPASRQEAINALRSLSARKHQVITGVCIRSRQTKQSFSSSTDVSFKALTDEEIVYYVDEHKPFDKAGAYGIQEWIGAVAVDEIKGSYYNVMGLPVHLLYHQMKAFLEHG